LQAPNVLVMPGESMHFGCCATGGAVVPLLFPGGTLMVGPSLTPSTVFDTASGTWQTKQTVVVGAVNLTDISFISAAVAALPASTGVRASVYLP